MWPLHQSAGGAVSWRKRTMGMTKIFLFAALILASAATAQARSIVPAGSPLDGQGAGAALEPDAAQ